MSVYDAGVIGSGEPSPGDPQTAAEVRAINPEHLEKLGAQLATRRERWISARTASGVESRWLEDLDQYIGRDAATKLPSVTDAAKAGYPLRSGETQVQRSTVFVNITRPKTNAAEARLANMLYPVDDKNWGIKPTPNPSLTAAAEAEARAQVVPPQPAMQPAQPGMQPPQPGMQPGMQPAPMANVYPSPSAIAITNVALQKAKAMENEIADALMECDFNAQGRLMLHDCALLGTGVLKGPLVVNRVAKAWTPLADGKTHVLELIEHTMPASERVDPWNVWPDPSCGDNVHNGVGIFEKKIFTGKQLRELVGQPGYLEGQIAQALEKGPQLPQYTNERDRRESQPNEPHYELWEYWGEFEPEDLRACGIDMPDGATTSLSGCVIMVGDIVIKGFVNPLETGELPYDFMQWERVDNSVWGYGIPFLCRPAQKVLTAAWRQMMDNAGMSVGPNVILKRDVIEPADGNWQITGRKIWNCTDASIDVRTAFGIIELPNNTEEFEQIIALAQKFADEESSVPMLAQGERGQAPETVGGMQLLMNSANVVLTRMVKQYDDYITRPHIRRYYDWFMAYSDKAEIKGDYQIDARGSSALLVRDMQQQALLQFGQFQNSPVAPMVNWHNWVKEVLKFQHIDPTDILKTDAEIAAILASPPPPSPDQLRAEATIKATEIRAQASLMAAKARNQGELAYAQTEAQMAHDNHQARIAELNLKKEIALLEYANKQQITLAQVKGQLAATQMQEETKRQLAQAELQLKANEGDKDRLHEHLQSQTPPHE